MSTPESEHRGDNHTLPEWIEGAAEGDLGTGLFLFESEESPNGRVKYLIKDLQYPEFLNLEETKDSTGYKWIPDRICDFETLEKKANCCGTPVFIREKSQDN